MREKPPHTDRYLPDTLKFLRMLGFKFYLDFDEQLVIEEPGDVLEMSRIMWIVDQCRDRIKQTVQHLAKRDMEQFVGGPFNGQRHDKSWYCCHREVAKRIGPRQWAAHRLVKDGRAFFVGITTSEKKARALGREAMAPT